MSKETHMRMESVPGLKEFFYYFTEGCEKMGCKFLKFLKDTFLHGDLPSHLPSK